MRRFTSPSLLLIAALATACSSPVVGYRSLEADPAAARLAAREDGALLERDSELLVRPEELGVDVREALGAVLRRLRRGEIADRLVVDGGVGDLCPLRLGHRQPGSGRLLEREQQQECDEHQTHADEGDQ